MNNKKAFPLAFSDDQDKQSGMSLLDYYAGLAMQSMVLGKQYIENSNEELAFRAFNIAETMLKESIKRNK